MKKIAADPEIYQSDELWIVEAIDMSGDGGIYTTYFDGPDAEERAREYAEWKFSGPLQHAIEPQRYQ